MKDLASKIDVDYVNLNKSVNKGKISKLLLNEVGHGLNVAPEYLSDELDDSDLPICQECGCPIPPDEPICNDEGIDLCEQCAWKHLSKLPKLYVLKEFYNIRPSRRESSAKEKDRIF